MIAFLSSGHKSEHDLLLLGWLCGFEGFGIINETSDL